VLRTTKTRTTPDINALVDLLVSMKPDRIFTEKLHPIPLGSNANFKLGGYLYLIRGICSALDISLEEITPKTWQSYFGIANKPGTNTKSQAYLIASSMFPYIELSTKQGKILDGRADAVLICEYGHRRTQ